MSVIVSRAQSESMLHKQQLSVQPGCCDWKEKGENDWLRTDGGMIEGGI